MCSVVYTRLLGRQLRRHDGISRLLLSAKHLQNLLWCPWPGIRLVWVLLLLVLYICAGRVGLSRLSGLGLIVGIVVGVLLILFIFIFAIVAFGCRLSIAGLRSGFLPTTVALALP